MPLPDLVTLPEDPRALIEAQHQTLRRFLANAIEIADAVLGHDEVAVALLSYTVLGLRLALERHALTEEKVILPVLEAEQWLRSEPVAHWRREQSRHLRALAEIAEGGLQEATLVADRLRAVAAELLCTMIEEERMLRSSAYFRRPQPTARN